MKKAMLLVLVVLAVAGLAMAQNWSSPVDVLGAHDNYGRGCAGCHQPHSGAFGSGQKGPADSGNYALWGQDASPLYGKTIAFGDGGNFTEVLPSGITTGSSDVGGILLCLSCHDGSVTNTNMMANQLYEQRIGLITNVAYGSNPIPTLLGKDGTTGGNYQNDHPVGTNATLIRYGSPMQGGTSGITWDGTNFQVTAGSNYEKFVLNYGYPAIQPGKWGPQYGLGGANNSPYVLCTTCHDQHVMTVYTSYVAKGAQSYGIAGDKGTGSHWYAKLFFVNGPYNPNVDIVGTQGQKAPSTTQFCRQCHFGEANEANNTFNIPTLFQ